MAAKKEKWLEALEKRVQQASERIRELKGENGKLHKRVAVLEARLTKAPVGKDAKAWQKERGEIRDRVEKLTESLERLLQ